VYGKSKCLFSINVFFFFFFFVLQKNSRPSFFYILIFIQLYIFLNLVRLLWTGKKMKSKWKDGVHEKAGNMPFFTFPFCSQCGDRIRKVLVSSVKVSPHPSPF
jgi:protein-S-isoprenylcysteine O-methyltransferase Ste14